VFSFTALLIEPPLPVFAQEKQVAGWVEYVSIYPGNLKIKAKLDTGARNSSLNAEAIDMFERNGETWVRFNVTNWKERTETIESKIIRIAKIKQHNTGPEKRPVIRLGICLGKIFKEVEVNLVDRGKFNYQLLIGRSFLKGSFIVDPSITFTINSSCRGVTDS
jgi:hypothetical protein